MYIIGIIIFICVSILSLASAMGGLSKLRRQQQIILRWLEMCPPEEIINSDYIIQILSSGVKRSKKKSVGFSEPFFQNLARNLSSLAIVFTNRSLNVLFANAAAEKFLPNIKPGVNFVKELSNNENLIESLQNATTGRQSFNFSIVVEYMEMFIHISASAHSKRGTFESTINMGTLPDYYAFVMTDRTLDIHAEEECIKEAENLRSLLLLILPQSVVSFVEMGRSVTISYNSVSIVFISIGGFGPVKTSPEQAMRFLSELHSRLKYALGSFRTLALVRSTALDFVVLGNGVDSKVSLETHTRDAVCFAFYAKSAVYDINLMCGTEIPVGTAVNSGGPITCGTYEVTRPYYDIFGSLVSITKELSQAAHPLQIVVTR